MPSPPKTSLRKTWTIGFQQVIFKRDIESGETAHPFVLGANALGDPFSRRSAVELFRRFAGFRLAI